ncbi:MAG: leucine-rich repeat protein, partial [Paludibacteraceae bacterium]
MKKSVLTFLIFLVCTLLFSLQAQNITAYVSGTATTYAIADLTEATANTAGNLANADSIVVSNTWTAANLLTLQKAMKATWSSTNSTTNSTLQKVDMRAVTLSGTGFTSFIGPAGFGYLFSSCTALTSVILPNTTTSTDVSFRSAFNGCTKLQKVENLDKFTKITDLEAAFQNCEALDSVRLGTNPNSLGSGYLGYTFTNTKVACLKYLPAGVNTIPQTWVSAGYKNFVLPITVGEVTVETYTAGSAMSLAVPELTYAYCASTDTTWQLSADNTFATIASEWNVTAQHTAQASEDGYYLRCAITAPHRSGSGDTVYYAAPQQITVAAIPSVANLTTPAAICSGEALALTTPTVTDNNSAVTGQGWQISGDNFTTVSTYTAGQVLDDTYNNWNLRYYATNTCGTGYSDTVMITVNPQPTVSLSATETAICPGSSTTLTASATDYTTLKWYADGVELTDSINETSITVSPTATTTYKAVAVNTVSDIYAKGAKATAADIAIGDIVTTDSLLVKPADWAKLAAAGKVAAGVVYHVNDDLTRVVGLDEGRSILWGFSGTDIPGLTNRTNDADALADFSGQSNTAAILAYNATLGTPLTASQSAAVWANAQGGYLPAAGELTAMMNNRTAINTTLQAISGTQISNNWFWSSSEYGTTSAWLVTSDGSLYSALKNYVCYVRSALAFPSIYLFNNLTISCESEAELEVVVNKTYNITESKTVCTEALPYTWNGVVFTEAGTKVAALQTKNGCDSTVTMTLTAIKLTIDSEEDLVDFRDAINDGTDAKQYKGVTLANGGAGMYFTLTADLDLSGICYRVDGTTTNDKSWRRIGSAVQPASPFQGSFDGGGHTIDNLYINAIYFNHGLFGKIENATVKNLSLTNAYIEGYGYLGGITGEMSHSEISYCHVSGIIKMEENQYRDYFAGICGTASDSSAINYCTVSGSVSGTQRVGGICGYISGEGSLINGCTNLADVTASVQYVGGIVSYVNGQAKITNCVNAGSVHNLQTNYTGGIAGDLFSFSNVSPKTRIENCLNVGNVTHDGPYGQGVVYGSVYGGISSSEVINCYYDKQMSTESQFGYNSSVEVESNHEGSLTSALVGEGLKG